LTEPRRLPLYARIMGDGWAQLAEPVRLVHVAQSAVRARGSLHIEHGRRFLARFLASMLRLPRPGDEVETRLVVTARAGVEHWERRFNGHRFTTHQYESNERGLAERFGVLEFRFHLEASGGALIYAQRDVALLIPFVGLRIPATFAPRVEAREEPAGPRHIRVGVRVTVPGAGLLIAYDGILDVGDTPA
jgi:hypothetical protein